jgi:hypothetical protein
MKKIILLMSLFITGGGMLKGQTSTTAIIDYDTLQKEKAIAIKEIKVIDSPIGAAQAAVGPNGIIPIGNIPVRAIYWIHGLGGNTGSWSPVKKATDAPIAVSQGFAPRNVVNVIPQCAGCYNCVGCVSTNLSYGQDGSMTSAAEDLRDAIELKYLSNVAGQVSVPNNNFIISHSQGGIASRGLDYAIDQYNILYPGQYQKRYNGIVTFGTPHQGAMVVNNTPAMEQYATAGAITILNGYVKKYKAEHPVFTAVSGNAIDSLFAKVVSKVLGLAIPIVFKSTTAPLAQSYKGGSLFLKDTLGPHTLASTYHKATFYGVEDEPILFRQMHSFIIAPPQNEAPFSANGDDSIYNMWTTQVNKNLAETNHADGRRSFFQNQEDNLLLACIGSWFITVACPICPYYACGAYIGARNNRINWTTAKDAFQDGTDFLNNMNENYKGFIGSYEWTLDTSYTYDCYKKYKEYGEPVGPGQTQQWWWTYDQFSFGPYATVAQCNAQGPAAAQGTCNTTGTAYLPTCTMNLSWKYNSYESDGVVLAKSAAGFPGDVYEKKRMNGANHQQLRNHTTTKNMLNLLFNGDKLPNGTWNLDPWFVTPVK